MTRETLYKDNRRQTMRRGGRGLRVFTTIMSVCLKENVDGSLRP
jgi:hypothetical protein